MSTLLVSDLHLGAHTRADVLRRPELRAPLLEALAGVDELILLGDVVELRDGPLGAELDAARGFFEDVGEALGARRVILVPGNHDYHLIAPWLERRAASGASRSGSSSGWRRPTPRRSPASWPAGWARPPLELAYPGLWLRPTSTRRTATTSTCTSPCRRSSASAPAR